MAEARERAIIARYGQVQGQLRAALVEALTRLWASLTSWREADAARFAADAVPLVVGAQRQVAALTDAYLSSLLAEMTGGAVVPLGVDPDLVTGAATRGGVDPEQVYRRPFEDVWNGLHAGESLPKAVERGERRARLLGVTDLQLTKTRTSREVLQAHPEVVGFRRVLTGAESCGLCVVASTQRYHKEDLLPLHPGCDCSTLPILADSDPGQVIDQKLLDAAHAAIEERFGKFDSGARAIDYRKVLLVRKHGELDDVLTVASHRFTSEADLS